jgi:hypothetical protein
MHNRHIAPSTASNTTPIRHAPLSNPHSARARHRRPSTCPRFPPLRLLGRLPTERVAPSCHGRHPRSLNIRAGTATSALCPVCTQLPKCRFAVDVVVRNRQRPSVSDARAIPADGVGPFTPSPPLRFSDAMMDGTCARRFCECGAIRASLSNVRLTSGKGVPSLARRRPSNRHHPPLADKNPRVLLIRW